MEEAQISTGGVFCYKKDTAILYGYVDPDCIVYEDCELGFFLSTSDNPSLNNGVKLLSYEINNKGYSVEASGLSPGIKYYYKSFVRLGKFFYCGSIESFIYPFSIVPIDLGLSVKWANANIGALKVEDFGAHYSWGELDERVNSFENKWYERGEGFIKYNTGFIGCFDNKSQLDLNDDVAYARLGPAWRMPTRGEWEELFNRCRCEWINQNGVYGRLIVGPSGESIFLPAAGALSGKLIRGVNERGVYWSSSLQRSDPGNAYSASFDKSGGKVGYTDRLYGLSVRPVAR